MSLNDNVDDRELADDKPEEVVRSRVPHDRLGRIGHRGSTFIGYNNSHKYVSPMHMFLIRQRYQELLIKGDFMRVASMENKNNYPITWLNAAAYEIGLDVEHVRKAGQDIKSKGAKKEYD